MPKRGIASIYASVAPVKRARKYERVTGRRRYAVAGPRAMGPAASRGFYGAQSRLKRQMQGILERKLIDTAAASYVCDTTGTVTLINGCAQGSDFTNRIGRKYTNVAVQLEGQLTPTDTNTNVIGNKCRVMLIYDAQPNGALPVITDVLTASTALSFMNLNNRDRFKVLCDENHVLGGLSDTATQALAGAPTCTNISVYKKVNLETICDGTTSGIADIQTGSIFLLTIGSSGAGLGHSFVGAVRIRFVDA